MQEEKIKGRERKEEKNARLLQGVRVWSGRIAREALYFGGAFVLGEGRLLFGSTPLGIALLCGTGGHAVAVLLGLLASALTRPDSALIYALVYLAAALIRLLSGLLLDESAEEVKKQILGKLQASSAADSIPVRVLKNASQRLEHGICEALPKRIAGEVRGVFSESIGLRTVSASLSALALSLYRIILGGFRFYDLLAALFCVAVAAAATVVFSVALDEKQRWTPLRLFSEGALLFSLVWSADGVVLWGLTLSPVLSIIFSLCVARHRGIVQGIVAAILCGLAHSPLNVPAFLLAVLAYLFFHSMGRESAGVLFSSLCVLLWSAYAMGAESLLQMIPSVLIAGCVFSLLDRFSVFAGEEAEAEETAQVTRSLDDLKYRDANDRFRGISDAFSSLSEMFYNLSDRFRRPGTLDLRRLCDTAFDSHCADCPNKTVCWGLEYSETLSQVNALINALHTKGVVSASSVGAPLDRRCTQIDSILEEINRECARLTGEMLRNNRTEIFAMDYEGAAKIISDALEEDDGEYQFDPDLERRIAEYLSDAGVAFSGVTVYGSRRRRILVRGADMENAKVTLEVLRCDLGEMCASCLMRPCFEVEHGVSSMVFSSGQKMRVLGAQNNISADGGISGDSTNLFTNKKDYFYALISDGMGAGHEAALTSGICSVFMEKMLRAGNRARTSLRMLNNMIRSRGADSTGECSSTIDLLELDLMTGDCTFIKSGAAPSFIIRGGVVRRMQAGTVPIGIICALDAKETSFSLLPGDTVVMVSDGVIESEGEGEWLASFLSGAGELTPDEIVYNICLKAGAHDGHDDCSAIALRIEAADT